MVVYNWTRYAIEKHTVDDTEVEVVVWYDRHGYWHASAPGWGSGNFGPRTAACRDMTVRDALCMWRLHGKPKPSDKGFLIPPGWTKVDSNELLA